MKAMLLAAGKGTRLGKLSNETPKCLQLVGGRPILDRLVEQLFSAGVSELLLNTHHLAEQVVRHASVSLWASRATIVHERHLLGTLGTLKANADFFGAQGGWILHADNFIEGGLEGLSQSFSARPEDIWGTMLTYRTDKPSKCGVIAQDNFGRVTGFFEKVREPPTSIASAATFVFDARALDLAMSLPRGCTDLSRDLIPNLTGRLLAVPAEGRVIDIGTPTDLEAAREICRHSPEESE